MALILASALKLENVAVSRPAARPRLARICAHVAVMCVGAVLAHPAPSLAATCVTPPVASLPIVPGYAVVTHETDCGALNTQYVVSLWDLRLPNASALPGQNWCAPVYNGPPASRWDSSHLGYVFGVTFDRASPPNIYVAQSTVYGDFPFPAGGGGKVFKLNGTTGAISLVATLSQPPAALGPTGLGDVCYDEDHNQLFVSNMNDGVVYQLNPTSGAVLNTYDHGAWGRQAASMSQIYDDPAQRFTQRGRRVWAVQYYKGRLYYSVWSQDGGPNSLTEKNAIWSVGVDSTGFCDSSTAKREFEMPVYGVTVAGVPDMSQRSYPVSDIAFSSAGKMLVAERGMIDDTGPLTANSSCWTYQTAHQSRVLQYVQSGGNWIPSTAQFLIGALSNHTNSAGGVDYTCSGEVWATGDALLWPYAPSGPCAGSPQEFVYGQQHIPAGGNSVATLCSDYFVDENFNTSSSNDKTTIGDIEIAPMSNSISGMKFADANCDGVRQANETGLFNWTIIATNDATGRQFSTSTNGSGIYTFSNLPPGSYTLIEQPQSGFSQSQPRCAARTVTLGCTTQPVTNIDFGNCPCPANNLDQGLANAGAAAAWQVVGQPVAGLGALPRPANVVSPTGIWCSNCGGAWVTASSTGNISLPIGDYTYRYCFCLDPRYSAPQLSLCILTDKSATVSLNGSTIGTVPFNAAGPCALVSTSNPALFRPGENCIEIVVHATGGPSGFNVAGGGVFATNGACCQASCPCVKPPGGMIGWWPLYETSGLGFRDIAGVPEPAAIYNAPAGAPGPQIQVPLNVDSLVGAVGQSACFDGINDYLEGSPFSNPAMDIGTGDFTIDAWIKTPAGLTGVRPIFDKVNFAGGGFPPIYTTTGYFLALVNGNAVGGINDNNTDYFATGPLVNDGKWHHLAVSVVRTSYTGGKLYVDGVPFTFDPTPLAGVNLSNPAKFRIGADHNANAVRYFSGCIDEVQFFRRALSAAEIFSIYSARSRGKCTESCDTIQSYTVCANQTSVVVTDTVCNWSASPQTYTVTPAAVGGAGCTNGGLTFAPPSRTITVQPYKCATASFTASGYSFSAAFQTACFEFQSRNNLSGTITVCSAKLIDRRDVCGGGPTNPTPVNVHVGNTVNLQFQLANTGLPAGDLRYTLRCVDDLDLGYMGASLNGLPPGDPVEGTVSLPPPGGPAVPISVALTMLDSSPFGAGTLELSTDTNNDGDYEPASSVLVIPEFVLAGDMNCNGTLDAADIGLFVDALVKPDAYLAESPYCDGLNADVNGDGTTNGADCQTFVFLWVNPSN